MSTSSTSSSVCIQYVYIIMFKCVYVFIHVHWIQSFYHQLTIQLMSFRGPELLMYERVKLLLTGWCRKKKGWMVVDDDFYVGLIWFNRSIWLICKERPGRFLLGNVRCEGLNYFRIWDWQLHAIWEVKIATNTAPAWLTLYPEGFQLEFLENITLGSKGKKLETSQWTNHTYSEVQRSSWKLEIWDYDY